ncbi:MAG: hypothetical protein FWF30_03120 [Coriobacteriia bacterium]|nr:hypothetical protein [Coriobacteriia bacterium]
MASDDGGVVGTYDHVTPLTHNGELPRCLSSLKAQGLGTPVIILVSAPKEVAEQASAKIHRLAAPFAADFPIQVIDAQTTSQLQGRMRELGFTQMLEGVTLRGYGAIRNVGLLVAALRGFTELVFIDDDEIVTTPGFLDDALYGLGKLSPKGVPILVKSGYFTAEHGGWKSSQKKSWYNRFWTQGELFNKWMSKAMSSARLSLSNVLNGGCMAIHREAFKRIAFDAWISRGEDLDYLLNVLMYGGRVWFDNSWSLRHAPPTVRTEGQRFRQDIFRWAYEHRKLEFSRSQIDLLQIQPHALDPYPGSFLERSVNTRAFATALLRTLGRPRDRQGYLKAAIAATREAQDYAVANCSRYFDFQRCWPKMMADLETDPLSEQIVRAGMVEAIDPEDY